MPENRVMIELSQAQIDGALGEAERIGLIGGVEALAGLGDVEFLASLAQSDDPRFSRSLLQGLMVLACFPADGVDRSVRDVARELDMGVSTTHRYISTLVEVGLLERDPVTREYRRTASKISASHIAGDGAV
jgi:hypothetical protein